MPIVKLISETEAQGNIKEAYDQIKQMSGTIPETFQAMANHPDYMNLVFQKMQVIMGFEEIDKKTKLMIAFAISTLNNCEMCITMYSKQLKEAGVTDKQIIEILSIIDLVGSMNHFNNGMMIKPQ